MAFFGLKLGLDLERRAAHPTKNSKDYPPGLKAGQNFVKRQIWTKSDEFVTSHELDLKENVNQVNLTVHYWQ